MCIRNRYLRTSERSYRRGSGTESVLGRPHGLLLSYTGCLGSAAREGGAASWAWGAAGSQSSKGLLAPRVRRGGSGWTGASSLGEGSRLEMSLESSPGGRGEARVGVRAGQAGHSQPHAGDGGPVGSNSKPEGLVLRSSASFLCSFVKHGVSV